VIEAHAFTMESTVAFSSIAIDWWKFQNAKIGHVVIMSPPVCFLVYFEDCQSDGLPERSPLGSSSNKNLFVSKRSLSTIPGNLRGANPC
jgi:hypothetical protein